MLSRFTRLLLLVAPGALCLDVSQLKPQGYLSDFAGVVDAASRGQIERYGREIEDSTGVQMAVVTISSLEGEPIEDVANQLFRAWGIGTKKSNEGVLLLLAIRERRSRLEVGYGLEPILPDGMAGSILRTMRGPLREQPPHYGDALILGAREIGSRILQAKGVSLESPRPSRVREPSPVQSLYGYLPFLLFLGLFLFVVSRSFRGPPTRGHRGSLGGVLPWLILDQMSRGRGGWGGTSHGGFGGYGDRGGGGFGGFGGGDSGGGGASSGW